MDELLERVTRAAIDPALAALPKHLDSDRARVLLLAIGLQESLLLHRRQLPAGPALGLWQFERGSRRSRGGVWGVYLHHHSHALLHELCRYRGCSLDPLPIHAQLQTDDVLAAGVARLLLYTDPHPLPTVADAEGAWLLYAHRTWRPGKPHPEKWAANHERARRYVMREPATA